MIRVLLDNCLDRRLGAYLAGYESTHVLDLGWERISDVLLLRFAAERFDVLLTVDQNMVNQTNLRGVDLAVVVFESADEPPS